MLIKFIYFPLVFCFLFAPAFCCYFNIFYIILCRAFTVIHYHYMRWECCCWNRTGKEYFEVLDCLQSVFLFYILWYIFIFSDRWILLGSAASTVIYIICKNCWFFIEQSTGVNCLLQFFFKWKMKMEKKIPTIERRNVHEVYIHILVI